MAFAAEAYAGTVSATIIGTATGNIYTGTRGVFVERLVDQPFTLVLYGHSDAFAEGSYRDDNKPPILGGSFQFGDVSEPLTDLTGDDPLTLGIGGVIILAEHTSPYFVLGFASPELVGYHYDHDFSATGLEPLTNGAGEFYQFLSLTDDFVGFDSFGEADLSVTYTPEDAPEPSTLFMTGIACASFLVSSLYRRSRSQCCGVRPLTSPDEFVKAPELPKQAFEACPSLKMDVALPS